MCIYGCLCLRSGQINATSVHIIMQRICVLSFFQTCLYCQNVIECIAGLVVNYGISNTIVLDIPYFTTKPAIYRVSYSSLISRVNCDKNHCTYT